MRADVPDYPENAKRSLNCLPPTSYRYFLQRGHREQYASALRSYLSGLVDHWRSFQCEVKLMKFHVFWSAYRTSLAVVSVPGTPGYAVGGVHWSLTGECSHPRYSTAAVDLDFFFFPPPICHAHNCGAFNHKTCIISQLQWLSFSDSSNPSRHKNTTSHGL